MVNVARRIGLSLVAATPLLLAACNNTYGPPPNGKPENWGQQHYLDVEKYRELNENRMR
jgi:hypothetical protein